MIGTDNFREFVMSSEDWIKYADSVGDYNSAHRNKTRLVIGGREIEGPIAPGMYTASRFQVVNGKYILPDELIQDIRVTFKDTIADGELVRIVEEGNGFKFFKQGDLPVCEVSINDLRVKKDIQEIPETGYFVYRTELGKEDVVRFLDSIHVKDAFYPDRIPKMQLAALSASALLDYGDKTQEEKEGIHIYQSVIFDDYCPLGEIEVRVVEQPRTRFRNFGLTWLKDGELIASGKSMVSAL